MSTRSYALIGALLIGTITMSLQAQSSVEDSADAEPSESFGSLDLEVDPNEILAYQGGVALTQNEIDAAFARIPERDRLRFIRDGKRVDAMVQDLLKIKLLAAAAEEAGFDQQPLVADRLRMAAEKELAQAWSVQILKEAPPADYEALAYEYYLANPEEYRLPDQLDVSHILISSEERGAEDALSLALSLREQLLEDPSKFQEFVQEYSEDPSKDVNGGRFPTMTRGDMVAEFEKAAFALESPGEISEPVETYYGYHLIRLNESLPGFVPEFERLKDELVAQAREKHLAAYRDRYMIKLLAEPIVIPDGAVEIMAKRHFGEDLELAPVFTE